LTDDVLATLTPPKTNGDAAGNENMENISETGGQDMSEEEPSANDVPDEIDENTAARPENNSVSAEDHQGDGLGGKPGSDSPDPSPNPKGFRIHIGKISIGPLVDIHPKSQTNVNLSWVKNPVFLISVVIAAIAIGMIFLSPQISPENELPQESEPPAVEEIFITSEDITLTPNEQYELKAAVLPVEATGTDLSYISMDTSIVTVRGHDGVLQALGSHAVGGVQYADIIIQAESGVTTTKTIAVDFGQVGFDSPTEDINDFVPEFFIIQKVRLVGTSEWTTSVNAEIGDKVEFQLTYLNNGSTGVKQDNVTIKHNLPNNLCYVPGSTKLYNTKYPDGATITPDAVVTNGIIIGNYLPNSNAYVRFTAEVVDDNLASGSNTLVVWGQGGVGRVTLQDYAAVVVQK